MEQYSQYLMWVKTKNNIFNNSSWEEEAFAEDIARGPLGGFIWPPRSYSCTFCRREFRSAQALGGHMNVHRRERAKLKQQQFLIQDDLDQNPQNPKNPNSLMVEPGTNSATVSYGITIGQENTLFDNSSDAKSCGTNLYLGFDGCDEDGQEMMNCKRQKMTVSPLVVGFVEDQVDLELRLAS